MGVTVIIAFAEALAAPEAAWSLLDQGFRVVVLARKGRRSALRHSRHVELIEVTPPGLDFERTLKDLQGVIRRFEQSSTALALMPLDDEGVWIFDKADLPKSVVLIGPRGDQAELALNKRKQMELAQVSGFSVPWTRHVEQEEEVMGLRPDFPVVLKPVQAVKVEGSGLAKGRSWTCADRNELEAGVKEWGGREPMLLQRFVPGVGEGLFGLATTQGVLAWSGHRRLRMMNPEGSGSSACTVVDHLDADSKAAGERFVSRSGWRGLFMIEMLRDSSGKLWFMEFNGRTWGSMALARRSGLEYPAWAARQALKSECVVDIPRTRNTALTCRHLGREILHLLFVLRGSRSKAKTGWPSFWTAFFQVCRISRNDRWYNWRKDDVRVFVSDCYGTVRDQVLKPR
jgi:hypothetical protein